MKVKRQAVTHKGRLMAHLLQVIIVKFFCIQADVYYAMSKEQSTLL